jgi:dTDP-4-amino-4,6-dideoxygalactose transaminase
MAALLLDFRTGDEVIMPSFTFPSTANAFALRGAQIVFVDVRPDTMNINEELIEAAITERTKAIVPVHYGGVACEMDKILELANKYSLIVIEDAAQGIFAFYRGRPLGSIGHIGVFSFHETKNLTSGGKGGLTIINDRKLISRAEIIREMGTDRSRFFRNEVSNYSWIDIGSNYLMNEISAAYLWAQIQETHSIQRWRMELYNNYRLAMAPIVEAGRLELQATPQSSSHNAHLFFIKVKHKEERARLINFLNERGVEATFHYTPLHSSKSGPIFGRFCGEDRFTTQESERLLRLPLFYDMTNSQQECVIQAVLTFFQM